MGHTVATADCSFDAGHCAMKRNDDWMTRMVAVSDPYSDQSIGYNR